jgi:hypothetical protein
VALTITTKDFIVRRQRGAPVIEHAYNQVRSFNELKEMLTRFIAWPLTEKPRSESLMMSSSHLPLGQSRLPRVLLVYRERQYWKSLVDISESAVWWGRGSDGRAELPNLNPSPDTSRDLIKSYSPRSKQSTFNFAHFLASTYVEGTKKKNTSYLLKP